MRVNFFVVAPPAALQGRPASYITSFHLAPDAAAVANELVRSFPNLTVIDVGMMIRQLQDTLDHVAGAVEVLFVLALAGIALGAAGVALTGLQPTRGILARPLSSDLWAAD